MGITNEKQKGHTTAWDIGLYSRAKKTDRGRGKIQVFKTNRLPSERKQ